MERPCLLITLLNFLFLAAQSNPGDTLIVKKKYTTQRLNATITLDGIPLEDA